MSQLCDAIPLRLLQEASQIKQAANFLSLLSHTVLHFISCRITYLSLRTSGLHVQIMKSLFFLFIICSADALLKQRRGLGLVCTFKDKTYKPGDSWHPYLEPFGFMFCMRCVCTESGHVKCNTIKCPALSCENPVVDPQQCCPRCSDEPRSPAGLRASVRSCRYNGSVYQPGESFAKHDLFPSKQSNQCAMCTCANGNIFCGLKTCLPVTCAAPVTVPDSCCLMCKDQSGVFLSTEDGSLQLNRGVRHSVDQCSGEQGRTKPGPHRVRTPSRGLSLSKLNLKGASETTVKILLQRKHQRACLYNGKTYSHGDMWHPVLGKVLECILCSCSDGLQDCKRITCPSKYPCRRPVKLAGKCCLTCPENKTEGNQTQCYTGYKNNLLVYKVEPALKVDSPNTVRIIVVEKQSTAEVEVQVWKTVEGVLQLMEIGEVQRKDITDHPENFTLLTTLDEDKWRKFKEEGQDLNRAHPSLCEDGIREMVTFLNPKQTEGRCSP
ncbi:chordin-like protein 2 [Synchiropus splendidus]|uniref:chordin-like protein 2 n=1 Tax=Synchiropus splendidus TaxID=270530 RepID=UPI00237D8990|nr:chordin-like protein 2 [Synchiropus splendidus]